MNKKATLLDAIEQMLSGDINEAWGICENLDSISGECWLGYTAVEKFSNTWESFSGEVEYPVSGKNTWKEVWYSDDSFWEGEQRELRISLLKHIKSEVLKLSNKEFEEMFK